MERIYIAHDVDGTLVDTNREVYNRTSEAWKISYGSEYPFSYNDFCNVIRPEVIIIEDIFILSHALNSDTEFPDDLDNARDEYRSKKHTHTATNLFYAIREALMKNDKGEWLKEQPLYEGVPEMLKELKSMGIVSSVISSKNLEAIEKLLNYHGIIEHFDVIIHKDIGKRPEQFEIFKKLYSGKHFTYDDMSENLEVAERMGITPIAAPQGYDLDENLEGFEKAKPVEVPSTIKKLLKLKF